jgi:hypothetical protein
MRLRVKHKQTSCASNASPEHGHAGERYRQVQSPTVANVSASSFPSAQNENCRHRPSA